MAFHPVERAHDVVQPHRVDVVGEARGLAPRRPQCFKAPMIEASLAGRRAFILENTRLQAPPHTPELRLHLADEMTSMWMLTEEALAKIGLPPPFWAFAWAGGQALARYVLDHPEIVAGKRVIDFASGSGLVAIAAMKAGAASVLAADIDVFARVPLA